MITTSSKFFYAVTAVTLLAAVVYGYTTGGGNVGPISLGYKGGVGDHIGYGLLLTISAASLFIGLTINAFRDANPEAVAELTQAGTVPTVTPPGPSYWPIIGAFGAGLTVVGLTVNNVFFVAGLIALGVVAVEWTVQAWADRATGDPAVNREVRNRIMYPFEVPLAGALGIAVVVLALSRVLLTVSKENAVWVAIVLAAVVFGVGAALSARPTIRKDLVAGLLSVFAVGVIAAGIVSAVNGEREIEHHGGESEDHGGDAEDHGDAPAGEDHSESDGATEESGALGANS